MGKLFIDENINILKGKEAEELLKKQNDSVFLSDKDGIAKVTQERWEQAQRCETKHWMDRGINNSDDRNYYHFKCFDNYEVLKNINFNKALEIGCGPFTNIRLISQVCEIKECDLLDPLINEYEKHPYVRYNSNILRCESINIINKVLKRFSDKLYYKFNFLLGKKILVDRLIAKPFEQIQFDKKYDIIIMVNVIEHCYDIYKIFENIIKLLNKNAYFVFADKIYEHNVIAENSKNEYDAAHPLRVDKNLIYDFLKNNFNAELKKNIEGKAHIIDDVIEWKDIYFIGKLK